jgi:hypothetical protein
MKRTKKSPQKIFFQKKGKGESGSASKVARICSIVVCGSGIEIQIQEGKK